MKINNNYLNLKDSYLFAEIAKRRTSFAKENPNADLISLGIGDVTLPLPAAVVSELKSASEEMGNIATFHGYGEYEGELFLREPIVDYYAERNVKLSVDEIFVSEGAKSDIGNILDIFDTDNIVLIPDPVYPVYVDTNVMAGRNALFLNASIDNGFLPLPDTNIHADLIYLCSPNNPTGAVYDSAQLKAWVDYALAHDAIILFDAAYESFIQDSELPRSIFEIDGARDCAIEFRSFSKTAGFTGTRCGYLVIPNSLTRNGVSINRLWYRRQSTKYNGTSYIIQRAAAAVFTPEGRAQTAENIDYYMANAKMIADALNKLGIWFVGGTNSPYIWFKCPCSSSWEFFDRLLSEAHIIGTPGAGFGRNGEGYFRLTAFGKRDNVIKAVGRLEKLNW